MMIGTQLPETCREVEINILRSSVHLVGFIWKKKELQLRLMKVGRPYSFRDLHKPVIIRSRTAEIQIQ